MGNHEFQYGPFAKGVFIALVSCGLLVPNYFPGYTTHYIVFILFLAFGLKPLLIYSRIYRLYDLLMMRVDDFRYKKINEQRAREVELKRRDEKYRHLRTRDKRLPKNW